MGFCIDFTNCEDLDLKSVRPVLPLILLSMTDKPPYQARLLGYLLN